MDFLSKKLGRGKKETKTTPAMAIGELRKMEELFAKKQEHLEEKIKAELEAARKNGKTNRRMALQALKRKKRYEQQLQQIDGTLATIEMQRESLESASTNASILSTMKLAADALKNAHNQLKVDDVHDIIDDIAEQQLLAKEIAEAVSTSIGTSDLDEDDLLKELEELEQEELDRNLLQMPASTNAPLAACPTVPTSLPDSGQQSRSKPDDLDDELASLQKWAA
ncbi:unnamed protein product [Nesidiocoris tenuis]|uniref:Uncharacterized protein n=1 Tax=Nesidiocoris tenuis TaxID=355587 RepID=A0A6H5GDF2_9HEMI|nr:unnamed protein product [Nesidiocoris tenuis]CAB0000899.1 unnamed protein product [Nesidiocoris tenuis]